MFPGALWKSGPFDQHAISFDNVIIWLFCVRPVKIIRLVGRSTVEEIVLKRADKKLRLTNTVIEGGKVYT